MSEQVCGYQFAVSGWELGGASITRRAPQYEANAHTYESYRSYKSYPWCGPVGCCLTRRSIEDEDDDEYENEPLASC
jgi:hypothetical protein